MFSMLTSFLVLVLLAQAPGQPAKAGQVTVSKPREVLRLAGDALRGSPVKLSWSPDGQVLYLLAVERDIWGNEKDHHYLLGAGDGSVRTFEGEPLWSTEYWARKSALACPGIPSFTVEVESRNERKTATGAAAGGSLAQNSGDPYGPGSALGPQGAAIFAVGTQSQTVTTTTFKVKGRVFSEFVNTRPILGLTYGWAPVGFGLIAYSGEKRALELVDTAGNRTLVKGTKDILLPAWSDDGHRLAWLAQRGRGKFDLMIADVSREK
jgi:hypothetical protein